MKQTKLILIFVLFILFSSTVLSFTPILLDGTQYQPTDTITLNIITDTNPEKGDPYTVEWYDNSSTLLQTDLGFLSNVVGGVVFETYVTGFSDDWINAYVNITAGATTQQLFFNVTGNASNSLIINNAKFSPIARLGGPFAIDFEVRNENNKLIDGAFCTIFGTDINEAPLQECTFNTLSKSLDGQTICAGKLNPIGFEENTQYLVQVRCSCGLGDNACFDEDGNTITAHKGGTTFVFSTTPWLSHVNTITDRNNYSVDDFIYTCVNLTNNNTERLGLDITYNWRCQNGKGDASTDRILLGNKREERGISPNKTQNQCNSFLIADDEAIEKGATNCYAATSVTIIDKNKNPIYTYETTSPLFNIMVDEINPLVRWNKDKNSNSFSTIVNIDDYDVGIKDIDVRVNERISTLRTPGTYIKSYTVTYSNGTTIPYDTEIQIIDTTITDTTINTLNIEKFEELTITILNVNTTLDEEFKVSLIVQESGEDNMLPIVLVSFFVILYYGIVAAINYTTKKEVYNKTMTIHNLVVMLSIIMSMMQLLFAVFIVYADYTGYYLRTILYINYTTQSLVFIFVTLYTIYSSVLLLINPDNKTVSAYKKARSD